MSEDYAKRKARMDRDPEYRQRAYRQQSASRSRRRARTRAGLPPVCPFVRTNGDRCWLENPHPHRVYLAQVGRWVWVTFPPPVDTPLDTGGATGLS